MPELAPLYIPRRDHLARLSLAGVIGQHARGDTVDLRHGTCTDDVARSIEVDLLHGRALGWRTIEPGLTAAMTYLEAAFEPSTGTFRNQRSASGEWRGPSSQDAHGRAVRALGQAVAALRDPPLRSRAIALLMRALPAASRFTGLRPMASTILGCEAARRSSTDRLARAETQLLFRLAEHFSPIVDDPWPWPEPVVTYDSALLAHALITGGQGLGSSAIQRLGLDVLDWLVAPGLTDDGGISFIGNDGWWSATGGRARFDQQPIEACSTYLAADAAHRSTGDRRYVDLMERAYDWFLGGDVLGVVVAEPATGGCHDALTASGVNRNQGAESTLAWLLVAESHRSRRAARTSHDLAPARRGSGQAIT